MALIGFVINFITVNEFYGSSKISRRQPAFVFAEWRMQSLEDCGNSMEYCGGSAAIRRTLQRVTTRWPAEYRRIGSRPAVYPAIRHQLPDFPCCCGTAYFSHGIRRCAAGHLSTPVPKHFAGQPCAGFAAPPGRRRATTNKCLLQTAESIAAARTKILCPNSAK